MNRYFKIANTLLLIVALWPVGNKTFAQPDTLTLLFIGDIMGHDSQIRSAHQADSSYNYTEVFKYIAPIISKAEVAIANLEVTLAGPPYKGYPAFSSPDALAVACKNAGIDIFGTANNHSVDRGKTGIVRTINVLDSLDIKHTGTFLSQEHRQQTTPFIIEQKGIKLALLNYTYGTNGIPVPAPGMVNVIDTTIILADIKLAKQQQPDAIIMFIHWGTEYQLNPNTEQQQLAKFLMRNGVNIIISSHPHVVQKSEWIKGDSLSPETFITYSLGNFVSNQRNVNTDGGQMIQLLLAKSPQGLKIIDARYILTWVHTPMGIGKRHFFILPCTQFEQQSNWFTDTSDFEKMQLFIQNSRTHLNQNNLNVNELKN
jgi:poly-gamma-glutamate capsule biosynthesis protein CapA/YwtB (metallophosphatase superfamily)